MTDILTRLAAFIDKSESGLWSEHRYGSPPDKGSSIWALDSYGQKARMLVYVGETEAHHQLSTEIVALHNNVASRQAALIALVQEAAGEIEQLRAELLRAERGGGGTCGEATEENARRLSHAANPQEAT